MLNQQTAPPLPAIFIGKDLINRRVTLYMQNKYPLLSQALSAGGQPREETRSIWYSKDHIKTWLEEIDHHEADGMRVYFGAYGEGEEGRPAGQLCLLMVLTRKADGDDNHKDIILEEEPDFAARLGAQKRSFDTGLATSIFRPKEYNFGAPCPPVCPGTLSFPRE